VLEIVTVNCETQPGKTEKGGKIGRYDGADRQGEIQWAVPSGEISNQCCQQDAEKAAANFGASIAA